MKETNELSPSQRGIWWYIIYFFGTYKERRRMAKLAQIPKPCCIKIQSSYHPYPQDLPLGTKYSIIGQKFLENKMLLKS